jgi:hypothetical protein
MSRIAMSYLAYINSPLWEERRRQYYRQHPRKCWACGSTSAVELHHVTYKNMGREEDGDLMPLCKIHHQAVHQYHARHSHLTLAQATATVTGTVRQPQLQAVREVGRRALQLAEKLSVKEHNRRVRAARKASRH